MNYRDKNGNCTADTVAKRCKCDHVILEPVTCGGECIMCEGGKCTSKPAKKESEKMDLEMAERIRKATSDFSNICQFCNVCPSFYQAPDGEIDCVENGRCEDVVIDASKIIIADRDSIIAKLEKERDEAILRISILESVISRLDGEVK